MLEAYIDGSCEPHNPNGTASYGVIVKQGGVPIFRKSGIVGKGKGMSNNVAEYQALIALVEWLDANKDKIPKGRELIRVYSDSKMLVYQMNGTWAVHGGMYLKYYEKATMLLAQSGIFEKVLFRWIPREDNSEADALSKAALLSVGVVPVDRQYEDTADIADERSCSACYWMRPKGPHIGCYANNQWQIWLPKETINRRTICREFRARDEIIW